MSAADKFLLRPRYRTGAAFRPLWHRIRRRLARLVAPPGELFNSDMSREIDRLIVENERLRTLSKVAP